jgi:trehalose synthase
VFIHDPQPAALIHSFPKRKGKWVWRCHIDVSAPNKSVWKFIKEQVSAYDASVFSLPDFAQKLPHPQFLITPSIDPLSEKNIPLERDEIEKTYNDLGIPMDKPIVLQVSRFDKFKDPLGVIESYRIIKEHMDIRLVMAGGEADDDPEALEILREVEDAAKGDPDISILMLPSDSHRTINALQSGADVVMQKSIREGFGLTVTEAMWKNKAVIGGNVGGIRLQVINRFNGFRVRTPEGAAIRTRYLLSHPWKRERMGKNAREYVLENFLITGHLKRYITMLISLDLKEGPWERWF